MEKKIFKWLSFSSVILGMIWICILFVNIFVNFNENIFNKDFYIVIGILFVFGLFWSELVGFVKNQIEEKIDKDLLSNILKENKSLQDTVKKAFKEMLSDDKEIKSLIFSNIQELEEEVEWDAERIGDVIKDIKPLKSLVGEKMKDWFTGKEIMQAFLETLKENNISAFILKDAYFILKDIYRKYFPENQFIEAKIRKILQDMRNENKLDFLWVGKYKILK